VRSSGVVCSRIASLVTGCLTLVALASPAASGSPPLSTTPEPVPAWKFGDEIGVRLVTVVVRVVDGAGNPVLGLAPGDFRVRVGRREVPVVAVDWEAATPPAPPSAAPVAPPAPLALQSTAGTAGAPSAADAAGEAPSPPQAAEPPGKLVVIFVQADNNSPPRVRGHLRTLPVTRELLDALRPEDSVAVVSFDSHLKLWQDFTRGRDLVPVIYQAIHFGGTPPEPACGIPLEPAGGVPSEPAGAAAGPSLARVFDFAAARRAASPERALAVTAEALSALPGEKVMVFLGWGLGTFGAMGTSMTPAFGRAAAALAAARTTVFVLDVTEADFHDLEVGLRGIADATGGTYDKTNVFPALAIRQLARTISGYYVLSLEAAALPASGGSVDVELRGRRGNVLLRPTSLPAGVGAR
jgi:VWFA-related protein